LVYIEYNVNSSFKVILFNDIDFKDIVFVLLLRYLNFNDYNEISIVKNCIILIDDSIQVNIVNENLLLFLLPVHDLE